MPRGRGREGKTRILKQDSFPPSNLPGARRRAQNVRARTERAGRAVSCRLFNDKSCHLSGDKPRHRRGPRHSRSGVERRKASRMASRAKNFFEAGRGMKLVTVSVEV